MDKLISLQAAIDEVQRYVGYIDQDMIDRIKIAFGKLPSAQPDLQQTCNKLATDCISRHAVSAWLDNIGHPKLADVVMDENRFPSAQSDFDITVKLDKAYDDGYEAGYLQGRHDWSDLDE